MRMYNLFFMTIVIILFFIASCARNQQNINGDLEFKKMCTDSGNEWMHMKPTQ